VSDGPIPDLFGKARAFMNISVFLPNIESVRWVEKDADCPPPLEVVQSARRHTPGPVTTEDIHPL
jgi:hypothetical protein